jgi:hypothetical protein
VRVRSRALTAPMRSLTLCIQAALYWTRHWFVRLRNYAIEVIPHSLGGYGSRFLAADPDSLMGSTVPGSGR